MSCTFGFHITVVDCHGCVHDRYPVRDDPACRECYKLDVQMRPSNYRAQQLTFTTIAKTEGEWRGDTDGTDGRKR